MSKSKKDYIYYSEVKKLISEMKKLAKRQDKNTIFWI